MSYETLEQWGRELPQGVLQVSLKRYDEHRNALDFQREVFRIYVSVDTPGAWALDVSYGFSWSVHLPRYGSPRESPEVTLSESLRAFAVKLREFYEGLIAQAQQAGVAPLAQDPGGASGREVVHRSYALRGEDSSPTQERLSEVMLLSCVRAGALVDPQAFQAWLSNPPLITHPGELYYTLVAPERAFELPWRHILYHSNRSLLKNSVAEKVLQHEDHRDFFNSLAALASLNDAGNGVQKLADAPLKDVSVALEAWRPQELLSRNTVGLLAEGRYTLNWFSMRALGKMPLAKAGFRRYLDTLPLGDLLVLLTKGDFRRSMSAELGVAHAKSLLTKDLPKPTTSELARLHLELVQGAYGEEEHHAVDYLWASVASLARTPAAYACARAYVNDCLAKGTDLHRDSIALVMGEYQGRWCAREAERDAILVDLVTHRGAQEAQRLILEVAALRTPLTAAQWHSYVTRAEGDFQGIPTVMWVKLI